MKKWIRYQEYSYKIDLTDVTFTSPCFMDHRDRKQNLDLSVCMLQHNFDTNIIIGEQGGTKFEYMAEWCQYMKFDLPYFHRTKMLNDMAMRAETPFLANWDCDVVIPPLQVYLAVVKLREGVDMVFPYDGRFARLPREIWFKPIEKLMDIGAIGDTEPKGKRGRPVPESSVGGAVFFNKESFIDGGMENENMISFGPEDCERNDRFKKLGFQVDRVGGCLYHIDHWCGPDSSVRNPFFNANHVELEKIRELSKDDLRLYVDTWEWRHKYTGLYYARISEGAIRSAKEIYQVLNDLIEPDARVIDIGCGVGEFNNDNPNYIGLDYKIPKRSLLIPEGRFINMNLEKEVYKSGERFELCLCLEVFEHISESRADVLISMLSGLSDRVLFSAAIKGQGGTGHINEQPKSYWIEKFKANGLYLWNFDIRLELFNNPRVESWYRSNLMLFTRQEVPINYEPDFIHPELFNSCILNLQNLLKG